jgi:broad specificity phosphatase PhoE
MRASISAHLVWLHLCLGVLLLGCGGAIEVGDDQRVNRGAVHATPAAAPNERAAPPDLTAQLAPEDCAAESDEAFCMRALKNCGRVSGTDNCGIPRLVNDCGSCPPPMTCGGGIEPQVCGSTADSSEVRATQTLVVVRHGQSRSNACAAACGGTACCGRYPCQSGCTDCFCEAYLSDLSDEGWTQVRSVLPDRLAGLDLQWDKILVSPAWRTQTTVATYLERHDLRAEIVPELDECSVRTPCLSGACGRPPWKPEPYQIIEAEGAPARMTPRPYRSDWDPEPDQNPRPQYDHEAATIVGEAAIMDRAAQYINELAGDGNTTILAITHFDVGAGLLQRLTGSSDDYELDNAAAYSVLERKPGEPTWQVTGLNLE